MGNNDNQKECENIRYEIDRISDDISEYESDISSLKNEIYSLENQISETRAEMKNKMTAYGVSRDFVVDAFIKTPLLAITKGTSDFVSGPSEADIEALMDEISDLEDEVEIKKDEIFSIGQEIRSLTYEKEDLVREWRFLECSRR